MPKKRGWIDSAVLDAREYEKALRTNLRELKREFIAESTEMRLTFNKDWRKLEADFEERIRKLRARIVQYEIEAHGKAQDDAVRAAKTKLRELRVDLRKLRSEYATVKQLVRSEFLKKCQKLKDEFQEARMPLLEALRS